MKLMKLKKRKNSKHTKRESKIFLNLYFSFLGAEKKFDPIVSKKKVPFGEETFTPTIEQQKKLDENWRTNVNFIPIPKEDNKYLKILKVKRKVNWEKYFENFDRINEEEN